MCLKEDPESKVACETATKGNTVMVLGEITTKAKCVMEQVVRQACKDVGYDSEAKGLDYKKACIIINLDTQSNEIANAVHEKKAVEEIGAGDQGMMLGYATNETKEFMPLSHVLATKLMQKVNEVRESGEIKWIHPDSKSQVTIEYK